MKSVYKNLVNDTVVFAAGNMLTKAIQFFLLPMYTAFLTTEQYGVGELVNNASELLYPLCCLGIYEGVFRYALDRGEDKASIFSSGVAVSFALAPLVATFGIAGYVLAGFEYTWQLVALCLIASLKAICLQFSKGLGKTRLYAASGVVGALALCVLGYALLGIAQLGVIGYLYALVASQLVQLAMVAIGSRIWRFFSPYKVSVSQIRRLLAYSLPMIPNSLAWWFVNLSGRYVVLFCQGAAVAGLYAAASKLPSVMVMLITVFQQSWQIFSARQYDKGDRDKSFETVFKVYTIFLLCSGSFVIAMSEPLSWVMLGGEFFDARVFVPALMLGAVVNGYSTYYGTIYNAAKRNGMIFVTTTVGACVGVAVGAVLAGSIGAWGPAIGTVVAYSIISVSRAIDTRRLAKVKVDALYQAVGIAVLVIEVGLLSTGVAHATLAAIGCSVLFMMFSAFRYRSLLVRLAHMLRKGR